jgi:hypothetical protein
MYKLGTTKRGEIRLWIPQATPDKAFRISVTLVRDQEVDRSNPFAPTISIPLNLRSTRPRRLGTSRRQAQRVLSLSIFQALTRSGWRWRWPVGRARVSPGADHKCLTWARALAAQLPAPTCQYITPIDCCARQEFSRQRDLHWDDIVDHRRQHCPLGQRALESRLFRIKSSLFSNPRVGGLFPFRTPTPGEIDQFFSRRISVDDMVKAN